MYEGNQFSSPLVKFKRISPLVSGFALIVVAGLMVMIPFFQSFFRTLALLPLGIGGFLLYQAIYKNRY